MGDTGWLQSPSPARVTGRCLNCTVAPGTRPATVVLACSVVGAVSQVLPPSVLYCHSYDARWPAEAATTVATPEMRPGFAAKIRARRVGVLRTATPAPSMIDGPFPSAASGVSLLWARACSRVTP